jgi:hypothetical protein
MHRVSNRRGVRVRGSRVPWLGIIFCVVATSLAACVQDLASTASPPPIVATVGPGDVLVGGELAVCTDPNISPDGIASPAFGRVEVSTTEDIALRMGLVEKTVNVARAAVTTSLGSRCDVGFLVTGAGAGSLPADAIPLAMLRTSILVARGNGHAIKASADLCGRRVALVTPAASGSAQGSTMTPDPSSWGCGPTNAPTIVGFGTVSSAAVALIHGSVDAEVVDSCTAFDEAQYQYSGQIDTVAELDAPAGVVSIATKPGNAALRAALRSVVARMQVDHSMPDNPQAAGLWPIQA